MKFNFSKINAKLKSTKLLIIVILSIITLNSVFYLRSNNIKFSSIQARKDASGFSMDKARHFIYFYYYTGNFPLATLNSSKLEYSKEGAQKSIANNGEDLVMEVKHWTRLGEHARILAMMPNALVDGSPKHPKVKLFNAIVFVLGIFSLFWGFRQIDKTFVGLLLIVAINLTPFFLYEIYSNQNIFGLLGSVFFIILGVNIPILFNKNHKLITALLGAVFSSVLIAFFSEMRNEVSSVLLSLLAIFFLTTNLKLFNKAIIIIMILVSFITTKESVKSHFNNKFKQTAELVEKHKGHVYKGMTISGHRIWHPIFCGLGDFDTKYGYKWNDKVAYRYAIPILNKEYGFDFRITNKSQTGQFYDKDSIYYIKYDEIDEYEEVVKQKVIKDIKSDPLWYSNIIFHRILKILKTTIPIPYIGFFILPLLIFLFRIKRWSLLNLLIVSLPLSISSLIIYSDRGITYNSTFVYMMFVVILILLFKEEEEY